MPIYHVTTEGDCEGRTTKSLGYIEADNPEQAIKHLESIGKHAYYEYWIDVVENPVVKAKPVSQLQHLIAEVNQNSYGGWRGKVKTNDQFIKEKEQAVCEAMKKAGISYEDVINFGKGL